MKTNHRRGFIAKNDRPINSHSVCNGHRGLARAKAGLKKFMRTRKRFHENSEIPKKVDEAFQESDEYQKQLKQHWTQVK